MVPDTVYVAVTSLEFSKYFATYETVLFFTSTEPEIPLATGAEKVAGTVSADYVETVPDTLSDMQVEFKGVSP
jgi:hypothetical protein